MAQNEKNSETFENSDVQEDLQVGEGKPCNVENEPLPTRETTFSDLAETKEVIPYNSEQTVKERSKISSLMAPLLAKNHQLTAEANCPERMRHALLCPPHGIVGTLLTWTLLVFTIWAVAVTVLGEVALPGYEPIIVEIEGGTVFSLIVLVVAAHIGGWLVSLIKLPPLLGMLIVGILLKNVPYIDVARGLDSSWSAALRSTALAVILLRAGLGLDPAALKQLSAMVFRLAFSPCMAECVTVAVASHFILDFPWLWGFMLGFVLAAVSPAVVVPCLLSLQERGYGVKKGIPTLVIAAASVDDVLAISGFTILLGITFGNTDSTAKLILQGPLEAVVGVVWGVAWGALVVMLPPMPDRSNNESASPSVLLRVLLLFGGSLLALFGSAMAGLPGSGALAVLGMGFVAGLGWRRQGWPDNNPVAQVLSSMWLVFQPLLFSLIGTEIQINKLEPETVGGGIGVLVCGIIIRILVSYLAVMGGALTHRERLFVCLAWLPKATVQAAIGPLALDMAKQSISDSKDPEEIASLRVLERLGEKVLTIAVLVILITAPIGAVAVMTAGPKLLEQTLPAQSEETTGKSRASEDVEADKTD